MLRNFFVIAFRTLFKNKVFSIVNICGLAIGMAVCWFLFEYVHFERSYDRWQKNASGIYRVQMAFDHYFSREHFSAATYAGIGPNMSTDFPEVLKFARLAPTSNYVQTAMCSYTDPSGQSRRFNEKHVYFADPAFLTIFSFAFKEGDPATALEKPNTVVMTASMAKKYFGNADPIGKTIMMDRAVNTVTGVLQDIPENSHIHFDMLISSMSIPRDFAPDNYEVPSYYTYVQLAPDADPRKIEAKMPAFATKYLDKRLKPLNLSAIFGLLPLTDIHLRSEAGGEPEPQGSEKTLYFLTILGVFILVIAWVNYVNLSTAKSLERAREVGVRKVAGASRWQLAGQFMLESMLVNMIALALTVLIVLSIGNRFDQFTGKGAHRAFLDGSLIRQWSFWLSVLGLFIAGALQVGAYPAFALSAFKPVVVLKGRFQRSGKGIFLRRALVTFQFLLSILLIGGTVVVYRQLQFLRSQDPGYNKDQLLVVKAPAIGDSTFVTREQVFKTELLRDPAILSVAGTSEVPGQQMDANNGVRRADQDAKDLVFADFLVVDKDFISTYGVRLAAGSNIPDDEVGRWPDTKQTRIMINESMVQKLGYGTPEKALHQQMYFVSWVGDIKAEIVGVVKDYQVQSLKAVPHPMMFYRIDFATPAYFTLKIDAQHFRKELGNIKKIYNQAWPGNAFESFFLNDHFDEQYQADQKLGTFFGLFTGLAIFVACLGLLGLSSYMVRLRFREIGIRKVLGAPVYSLLLLLSKDFVRLIGVAALIAIPVIYWAAHSWLQNYAFHIQLGVVTLLLPPLLLLIIALLTIGVQSIKAALAKPVDSLKTE